MYTVQSTILLEQYKDVSQYKCRPSTNHVIPHLNQMPSYTCTDSSGQNIKMKEANATKSHKINQLAPTAKCNLLWQSLPQSRTKSWTFATNQCVKIPPKGTDLQFAHWWLVSEQTVCYKRTVATSGSSEHPQNCQPQHSNHQNCLP